MKLKDITKEELELMGYDDIAYLILQEEKKKMKINDLFKKVCDILNLSNQVFENQIADFFAILTTDKRFIMLEDGFWDLKIKHNKGMESFDEEDDSEEDIIIEDDESSSDDEIFDDSMKASDDDVDDDDLSDLVIVDDIEDDSN